MLHLPVSTCRRNKKRTFGDRSRLKKREIVATHTLGKLLLCGFQIRMQQEKYSDLPNNHAANLIIFWRKKTPTQPY